MRKFIYIAVFIGLVLGSANFALAATDNRAPIWGESRNYIIPKGQLLNIAVSAFDPDGDRLTYGEVELPYGSIFDKNTRSFRWRPSPSQLGKFQVVLSVHDSINAPVNTYFYITVVDSISRSNVPNKGPVFGTGSNTRYTVEAGQLLKFAVIAQDPENDPIYYSVSSLPLGAKFDPFMHEFTWTPNENQIGFTNLSFRAVDKFGHSANLRVAILVKVPDASHINPFSDPNDSPYFTSRAVNVSQIGELYFYQAQAIDPEGEILNFGLVRGPEGSFINQTTGLFTWLPSKEQSGQSYQIIISVKDYTNDPVNQEFLVTVSGSKDQSTVPVKVTSAFNKVEVKSVPVETKGNVALAKEVIVPEQPKQVAMVAAEPMVSISPLTIINIGIGADAHGNTIIRWHNSLPATAEILFGTSSVGDEEIDDYDFTTGEFIELKTHHEINLGQLRPDQTYYLRIISKGDGNTAISPELIFVPEYLQVDEALDDVDMASASILGATRGLLINPWIFGLLILIIFILLWMLAGKRS